MLGGLREFRSRMSPPWFDAVVAPATAGILLAALALVAVAVAAAEIVVAEAGPDKVAVAAVETVVPASVPVAIVAILVLVCAAEAGAARADVAPARVTKLPGQSTTLRPGAIAGTRAKAPMLNVRPYLLSIPWTHSRSD